MTLTEKQKKYRHYHPGRLINMNILQLKNYCPQIKEELYNKEELQNKLSLHIFFLVKLQKYKKKIIIIIEEPEKKQVEALKVLKTNTQKLAIKYVIAENT